MDIPIRRTKIIVPRRRANLLSRHRLLDLLQRQFRSHTLVLVSAPAGYGKTSLLIDVAHRVSMPACWFTIETPERDLQRFLAYCIAAIAERFPDFGRQSHAALNSDTTITSNTAQLDRLITTIVNEIYETISEEFIFVLDDYHLVESSESINHFVSQFIQSVDSTVHLAIASRTLLSLPDLSYMIARSQVAGVSLEELRFRSDEIQALISQNYGITIPDTQAEELATETEGWITGLLLSAETMWHGMADRLRVARASGVGLYDYLAEQVLNQQPAPVRDFLLRTSPLEEFDAAFCEAVFGPAPYSTGEDWTALIDHVLRHNIFVLPVDTDEQWLRYHQLFREFLQKRLAEEQPETYDQILRRLITVYTERGEWEKAFTVCQQLQDTTTTMAFLQEVGSELIRQKRYAVLHDWLSTLRHDDIVAQPQLVSLYGTVTYALGQLRDGLALLDQAVSALRNKDNRQEVARALVRRAGAYYYQSSYGDALSDVDEAIDVIDGRNDARAIRAEALKVRGLTLSRMGRIADGGQSLKRSLAEYEALDDAQNTASLSMDVGLSYWALGDYSSAERCFTQALTHWHEQQNALAQANVLNSLGLVYHSRGDYERALQAFEKGVTHARRGGDVRLEGYLLCSIGDLYADLDAPEAARDAYQKAEDTTCATGDRFLSLYLHLVDAGILRASGNVVAAQEALDAAKALAEESDSPVEQGLWHLEAGRLALADERLEPALDHLERATHCLEHGDQTADTARAYLVLASAYHHAGGPAESWQPPLQRAFSLMSRLDSWHSLVVAARTTDDLLISAAKVPELAPTVSRLSDEIAQFERRLPHVRRRLRRHVSVVPFAPPRLSIRALGRAQVDIAGTTLEPSDWQLQAARTLFFCILSRPNGLTKDEVIELCWPDTAVSVARKRFKNALYHARNTLGSDAIQLGGERYYFNREIDYQYDVERFRAALEHAEATHGLEDRVIAYRRAADLYTGPYLADIDGIWVLSHREQLRQHFVEALIELAALQLQSGDYAPAVESCQRALAEDPSQEAAYRIAMRAHFAMGNRAEVVRQYEHCRETLRCELDVAPSPQTESLYQQLIR